jgi:hypothetical protein
MPPIAPAMQFSPITQIMNSRAFNFSSPAIPAEIKLTLNPTSVPDEYEAIVSISNNTGIAAYHLELLFDSAELTPVSINSNDAFGDSAIFASNLMWAETESEKAALNEITAVWSSIDSVSGDGVLFTVLFKATPESQNNLSGATVTLSAIDVLGHDLTFGFEIIDVITNLSFNEYTLEIDVAEDNANNLNLINDN